MAAMLPSTEYRKKIGVGKIPPTKNNNVVSQNSSTDSAFKVSSIS